MSSGATLVADLETSRRRLEDIRSAARRGVHRPELVVAARRELERLSGMRSAAAGAERRALEELLSRYDALVLELLD